MSRDPAELLDIAALVAHGSELEFEFELESLRRIAPLLRDCKGTARGRFRFHGEAGTATADGHVRATLLMTCQRCMGEVAIAVDAECRLVLVDPESAEMQVAADRELVTTQGGRISPAELVEDELLLALPLVAVHGEGTGCAPQSSADAKSDSESTQRPFAGLRELMKD